MNESSQKTRIALTGFMGVGKSTVSRHIARILKKKWIDLDEAIERAERRSVAEVVENEGIEVFRSIETTVLKSTLNDKKNVIISLGGGAFTTAENRKLLTYNKITTIWLGASFEHCWANISSSYKERPLARDRKAAKRLFDQRIQAYCLADWHFVIMHGCNSYAVAEQIAEQAFGVTTD